MEQPREIINSEENKKLTNYDAYLSPPIDIAAVSFDPDNNHQPSSTSALENPEQAAIAKALQFIIDAKTLQEKAKKIADLKTLGFIPNVSYANLKKLNDVVCSITKAGINENKIPTAETLCYEFLLDRLWELAPLDHVRFYHALGQLYLEKNYYLEALPYLTRALEIIKTYEAFVVNENFQNSSAHKKLASWLTHPTWEQEKQTLYHHVTQLETGYFSAQIFLLVNKEIAHLESLSPQQIEQLVKRFEQLLKRLQPLFDGLVGTEQWPLLQEKYKTLQPLIHHYLDVYLLPALEKVQEKLKTGGKDLSDQDWFQTVLSIAKQWEVHHQYDYAKRCYQLLSSHLAEGETKTQILMYLNRLEDYQTSKSNPSLPAYTAQWSAHCHKLQTFRENFEKRFHDKQFSHYHLQNDYTQDIKQLLNSAINTIVKLLGVPPCIFHLVGIGSLSRGLSPYSDIELAMLIQDAQYKQHPYFQVFIALLDFHLKTLADPWAIAEGKKEWVGLHIDEGCLKKLLNTDPLLINTPAKLVDWVVAELSQPSQDYLYAYALLRPVSLYIYFANDKKEHEVAKALVAQYSQALQQHLDPVSTDLDHEGATKSVPPHRSIATSALDKHQKEFHKPRQAKKNQQTKNLCQLKNDYLSPLLYLCFDLGLYFNVRDENRTLYSTIPEILSQLEATEPYTEKLLTRLLTVYKAFNRLRDAQQFLRGHQPDEVQLPAYFDPGQAHKGKDPILLADETLPALTKEEQDYLNDIDQSLLQVIYQDIHAFVNHLQVRRTSGLQKSFHTYPVSPFLLSNPSHHKNIVSPPGFFQLGKNKSENTLSFTSMMMPEVQLLTIEYHFQQKNCFKRLEQGMRRGQLHWNLQQSPLKTKDALLNPAMAELKTILQKCYKDQPKIPLLLDETKTFALDEIFIDLELIEQKAESKTDRANSTDETQSVEQEDSLTAETRYELQAEIRESRKPITPEQLFLPLAEDDTSPTAIYRLYLQGAAGIGKTTLCRHLAYRWADPNNPLWADQFTLVIYFPLRQVVKNYSEREAEYSLKEIILGNWSDMATLQQRTREFNECFIQDPHKQALWEYMQQHRHQILFLLDGLDEVDSRHPAIKGLLNSDICYIVTSRPQAIPSQVQRYVENVGFTEQSRNNYIQNFFKLMQQPTWADLVVTWIKENTHLTGLIAIAINCQLFCTAMYLQQLKAQEKMETREQHPEKAVKTPSTLNSQFTLTELYAVLMLQWEKRALLRDPDLKLTPEKLRYYKAKDVHKLCAERLQILAKLSYQALCQAAGVIIPGTWLEEIIEETLSQQKKEGDPETRLRLAQEVLGLGVLKAQGLSDNLFEDQFDFAHLTFVEYLAAYHIAQGFEVPDDTPQRKRAEEALLQYQYHPKFEVMWWFVSGHLATMQGSGLKTFFTKLVNGPHDLNSGRQYIQLLYCYEQAFTSTHLPKNFHTAFLQLTVNLFNSTESNLIKPLKKCPKFTQTQIIQEFLIKAIEKETGYKQPHMVLYDIAPLIANHNMHALLPSIQRCLSNPHTDVDYIAFQVFNSMLPELTPEQLTDGLSRIQQCLCNPNRRVCYVAERAFKVILSKLTLEHITATLSWVQQCLKNLEGHIRVSVLEVFKAMLPKLRLEQSAGSLSWIQECLIEIDRDVRVSALEVFKAMLSMLTPQQAAKSLSWVQQFMKLPKEDFVDHRHIIYLNGIPLPHNCQAEDICTVLEVLKSVLQKLTLEQITDDLPWAQQYLYLQDTEWKVRLNALKGSTEILWAQLKPERCLELLPLFRLCQKDQEWLVRISAWKKMKGLRSHLTSKQITEFLSLFQQSFQDLEKKIRISAWKSLQNLWWQLTAEQCLVLLPLLLQQSFQEKDKYVRYIVWKILKGLWSQLKSEQITAFLSLLEQSLRDPQKEVRTSARETLGDVWPQLTPEQQATFLSFIQQSLQDRKEEVRISTWEILKGVWSQLKSEQITAFLSLLEQSLRDPQKEVRTSARERLEDVWSQLTADQITAFLPLLQELLQDYDEHIHARAWETLGEFCPRLTAQQMTAFLSLFPQGLQNKNWGVRANAWKALKRIWPRLTAQQMTAFLSLFQQGPQVSKHDIHDSALKVFAVSLFYLTSPDAKKFFINTFIQWCLDKKFMKQSRGELNVIKYNATTLHLWENQTKVEFTVTAEQMAQLEEAFKEGRLDLVPLQKALQEDTLSLSQSPMTYFNNTLTRNNEDDSPSSTIPKPGM